jgi:hypothetical protein
VRSSSLAAERFFLVALVLCAVAAPHVRRLHRHAHLPLPRSGPIKTEFFLVPDLIPAGLVKPSDGGAANYTLCAPLAPDAVHEFWLSAEVRWRIEEAGYGAVVECDLAKRGLLARTNAAGMQALRDAIEEIRRQRRGSR